MTLSQLTDIAQIFGSLGTFFLAIFVFIINRRHERQKINHDMQNWWQQHNSLVMSDPDLLKIEANNHPHGKLSPDEVKLMYFYFSSLNIALNSWSSNHLANKAIVDATMDNFIEITYRDHEFIIDHVLKRGYPRKFVDEMKDRYKKKSEEKITDPKSSLL